MKLARLAPLVALVAHASACGSHASTLPPEGQLLVYIDTDAPLPAAIGTELGPNDPPPLFDRLRIDVVRPGESAPCADCTHEFDVDRDLVGAGRASIGITPPVGASGYRVRVRLFRAAFVEQGEPRPDATLETVASLPPIAAEGITPVTIVLHTDDVAHPIGTLAAPVPASAGPPAGGLVGTWPGAVRRDCGSAPEPGEVCVPGGAYWMGNPLARLLFPNPQVVRLVSVAPFFLDASEVTVESFRAAHVATGRDPMRFSPTDGAPGPIVHCTYRDATSDSDNLAVTCLSWERARAYCRARGADLPTEAQFQYASSGLASHLYVWGDDEPRCEDAMYARTDSIAPELRCPGQWVAPAGSAKRDRLVLPSGGVVFDLAGNVTEHLRDVFAENGSPCWGIGAFHDPVCQGDATAPHTIAGGSYTTTAAALVAVARAQEVSFADALARGPAGGTLAPQIAAVGFRCAR